MPDYFTDIVLAFIRLLLAVTFIYESRVKFKDIKKFAKKARVPLFMAYFIASAEMMIAVSMATGILSQWAAIGIFFVMAGALRMHFFVWKTDYWAGEKGWEYDLIQIAFGMVILNFGPGAFALSF